MRIDYSEIIKDLFDIPLRINTLQEKFILYGYTVRDRIQRDSTVSKDCPLRWLDWQTYER